MRFAGRVREPSATSGRQLSLHPVPPSRCRRSSQAIQAVAGNTVNNTRLTLPTPTYLPALPRYLPACLGTHASPRRCLGRVSSSRTKSQHFFPASSTPCLRSFLVFVVFRLTLNAKYNNNNTLSCFRLNSRLFWLTTTVVLFTSPRLSPTGGLSFSSLPFPFFFFQHPAGIFLLASKFRVLLDGCCEHTSPPTHQPTDLPSPPITCSDI